MGITLIGMPGCGKSTIGVVLAKQLALPFVDTDIELQNSLGGTLQHFIDQYDYMALREKEEACILDLPLQHSVIATGGSVVYSNPAIQHLKSMSLVVFLDISYATMMQRLGAFDDRGIAADISSGLKQVYLERHPLYQQVSGYRIDAEKPVESLVDEIAVLLP